MNIDLDNVSIEIANVSHLKGLKILFSQLIPDEQPAMKSMKEMLKKIPADCNKIFVAIQDGLVLGTAQLLIYDNLIRVPKRKGMIDSVIVHKDYRDLGIGSKLIRYMLEDANKQGVTKLYLFSGYQRSASHPFYHKLGFKDTGYCFEYDF